MKFKHTPTEARKLWVEALRSGEFKQTKYVLCDLDDCRCCLGVAVELFCRHEQPLSSIPNLGARHFIAGDGMYHNSLPPTVSDWLGLASCGGDFGKDDSLWRQNDSAGASFTQIADIIESAPPGLFVETYRSGVRLTSGAGQLEMSIYGPEGHAVTHVLTESEALALARDLESRVKRMCEARIGIRPDDCEADE